jgi:hypothetical protein
MWLMYMNPQSCHPLSLLLAQSALAPFCQINQACKQSQRQASTLACRISPIQTSRMIMRGFGGDCCTRSPVLHAWFQEELKEAARGMPGREGES